jgi:hypothetical protein
MDVSPLNPLRSSDADYRMMDCSLWLDVLQLQGCCVVT